MSKQLRSTPRNARDPTCRPSVMATQLFVFALGPKDQILVQCAHRRIKRRAIISPVILEPAADNRIEHPRQIVNRLVAAVRQVPAPKSVANRLRCFVRDCGAEIDEELPLAILRSPRLKTIAEKIKRFVWVVLPLPKIILCNRRFSSSPDGVPVRKSANVQRWPSSFPGLPSPSCSAR